MLRTPFQSLIRELRSFMSWGNQVHNYWAQAPQLRSHTAENKLAGYSIFRQEARVGTGKSGHCFSDPGKSREWLTAGEKLLKMRNSQGRRNGSFIWKWEKGQGRGEGLQSVFDLAAGGGWSHSMRWRGMRRGSILGGHWVESGVLFGRCWVGGVCEESFEFLRADML